MFHRLEIIQKIEIIFSKMFICSTNKRVKSYDKKNNVFDKIITLYSERFICLLKRVV